MPAGVHVLMKNAPAKVNLGLHVLRRRSDGYHDIETVMVAVGWCDVLEVDCGADFAFTSSDPALPTDERNLCVRAARNLAEHLGIEPSGRLHLEKHLPHGAGLGGGSSDAAAALRLLSKAWQQEPGDDELLALAAGLGSDVPFFLDGRPTLATGRGELLHPLSDYTLPFALAIVMPDVRFATAEAYRLVKPRAEGRLDLEAVVRSNDLERWRHELVNDFDEPTTSRSPPIARVHEMLREAGAGYVSLSGSGASVYGVFEDWATAQEVAEGAHERGYRSWWGSAID